MGRYEITADSTCDVRPDVFRMASEQGLVLVGLKQQENTLETIFQSLTK
jgi:ABC-2 type transport system ATP-binding protein